MLKKENEYSSPNISWKVINNNNLQKLDKKDIKIEVTVLMYIPNSSSALFKDIFQLNTNKLILIVCLRVKHE